MYGLILLAFFIAFVYIHSVSSRLSRLEKLLEGKTTVDNLQAPAPSGFGEIPAVAPAPTPIPHGPTAAERFGHWLREDWLLKLGALLLLIGFGWLTTYAFLNNWIGPMGRIALGIVAGTLFLVLGWWRIQKYVHQGGIFMVLGSTTILLTTFAARSVYGYFTPLSALTIMFLSTAFVALASVKYRSRALSLCSLILAGIAPLLTNGSTSEVWLFSYLLVVTLGAIWVVALTGMRELTMAALIMVALHSSQYYVFYSSVDRGVLLLFMYAFAGVFFLTNTVGMLRLSGKALVPDILTAAGNGLLLLAWIMRAAPSQWQSLIIAAWMFVFAVGAFLVFRATGRREPFFTHAGVAVMFLAAATSAELSGATLTIAYTIEAVCVAFVALFATRDIVVGQRLGLLLIVPIALSTESLDSYVWQSSVFHKDFFVLLILAAALFTVGLVIRAVSRAMATTAGFNNLNAVYLVFGSLYAFALLWLSLHVALDNDSTAVMLSLLVYTIVGLFAYFYGRTTGKQALTAYGGLVVGFVVVRLLFVEVWHMELAGRIITFFVIGALLVGTAFFGRKKAVQPPVINQSS